MSYLRGISSLSVAGFLFLCPVIFADYSEKPRLEVSEVVIEASASALTGGSKDPVAVLETQTKMASVSDTLKRLTREEPGLIVAPDEPGLQVRGGCLTPLAMFGTGVKSRMARASKAWEALDWKAVIDQLTPVINHREELREKPEALYFVGRSKHYLGDRDGAIAAYEVLCRDYPTNPHCEFGLYSLGWLHFENKRPDLTLQVIESFYYNFAASPLTPYIRYLRAAVLNMQGLYRDSLHDLEGIVAGYPLFPDMDDVQFWTAENLYFLDRFESAADNYALYISNYPDGDKKVEALYGRAFSNLQMKSYEVALTDFRAIVQDHVDHPFAGEAGFQGGKLAVFLEVPGGATVFFEKALLTYRVGSPRKYEAQAWIDYEGDRYDASAKGFAQAAAAYATESPDGMLLNVNRAEMLFLEALSYMRAKNYALAAEKFDFLSRTPDLKWTSAAQANAGIAWLKLDRPEQALQRLQEALASPEPLQARALYMLYAAEILYRLDRFEESITIFTELESGEDVAAFRDEVVRGIAWNHYSMKNWDMAARAFGDLIERFPDTQFFAEALLRRAESRFNNGDYDLAKDDFKRLISEFPLHPEAFEARLLDARSDWIRGNFQLGMDGVREALKFAPDASHRQRVRMTLGELLQEQGRYEEAVEEFRQAYQEDVSGPGAAGALIRQADNLYNLGDYDKSTGLYRSVIGNFPESELAGLAQYSIGLIYFRQDRLDEYLRECRSIAASRPGTLQSALALNGASSILVEQGRYQEAIEILRTLRDKHVEHVDQELVRFRLGQSLNLTDARVEAAAELNDLIRIAPTGRYSADASLLLADMAAKDGDFQKSANLFKHVIELFPYHPRKLDAIRGAADAYATMKQWSEAERLWVQLIDESGNSGEVLRAHLELGKVLLAQGQLEKAASHAEMAARSTQREVIAQSRLFLSEIKEKQGDKDEALKGYLKIGYLFSEQSEIVFDSQMAAVRVLIGQRKTDQARSLLEKAKGNAKTTDQLHRLTVVRQELEEAGGKE